MNDEWAITAPAPVDELATSHQVPMTDGIRLATDVYLPPNSAQTQLPTVLVRLPYDKSGRYTFLPAIAARLIARGFAAVVQDVRGKFRSAGNRIPFVNEASDGADTLDWITNQPWSNGVVGMMGDSYYGFTQWAAASTGHSSLRAIVPRFTGSEFFRMFGPDEVVKIPLYEWVVETFSAAGQLESPNLAIGSKGTWWRPVDLPQVAIAVETLEARVAHSEMEYLAFPHGTPAPNLQLPALHMGGWWDNLQRFQLDDWKHATCSPAAEHQFLRMAAADHEDYHLHEDGQPHHNHGINDDDLCVYLDRMMIDPLDFFDHYLRDRPGSWPAPRVRYEIANAGWRTSPCWEPADTIEQILYFTEIELGTSSAEGGCLSVAAPGSRPSVVRWNHDPANPVPYLAQSEWGQCADLPDESVLHDRGDVVTLTAPSADEASDIIGHVEVELTLSATSSRTHAIVRLLDVYPSGRARVILEGAQMANTDCGTTRVVVNLGDTAYRLRRGHSLRVAISASCFPLYPVSPGRSDESEGDALFSKPGPAESIVHRLTSSQSAPSLLRLRVANSTGQPLAQFRQTARTTIVP